MRSMLIVKQKTNANRVRYGLFALGVVLIGVAWVVRETMLAANARSIPFAATAARNARTAKLEAEAAALERKAADTPNDLALHQKLLILYHESGQPEKEIAHLSEIVRLGPDDQAALIALAKGNLALKKWPKAEAAYRDYLQRWPKSADGWQGLSATLFHEARYREAAVAGRSAVKLKPENPSNHYVLAVALLEDVLQYPEPMLHSDELEMARGEFERLVPIWPKTGDIYFRLGRVYMVLKKPDKAILNLERAQQYLPNRTDCSLYLARAHTSARNGPAARKVLEAAVANHPDSAELSDALGQLIQASGEPGADQKSLSLFQNAVAHDQKSARFIERLGTAFVRTNDLRRAQEAFELAARLNPNRAFPFQQLAGIYTRQGDPVHATAAARTATALDFNEQQFKTLQAVAKRHPENVPLQLTLADRYRFLGMRGPARDEYRAILLADPKNKRATDGLTSIETERSNTETASASTSTPNAAPVP